MVCVWIKSVKKWASYLNLKRTPSSSFHQTRDSFVLKVNKRRQQICKAVNFKWRMKSTGIMKVDVIDNRRRIEWKRLNNKIGFGHSIGRDLQDDNGAPNSIFRSKVGGLAWRSVSSFFYLFSWNNHRIMISRQRRTLERLKWMKSHNLATLDV